MFIAVAGAIIYSFIADAINFDWIIIGFALAVVFPVTFVSQFSAKKMAVRGKTWIIVTAMFAVIVGFAARTATQAYILYDLHLFPEEKSIELEEDSYLSDQDTRSRLDELLRQKTGYPSYVGAFIWYLNNTTVKDNNYSTGTPREMSFQESVFSWLADLGVGLLAVGTGLWAQLAKLALVCERCGKEKNTRFFVMGPPSLEKQIIQEAKAKNLPAFKGLYAPKSATPQDFISLKVWYCENCKNENAEIDFVVTKNGRPFEKMTRILFSAHEFEEVQKMFQKN